MKFSLLYNKSVDSRSKFILLIKGDKNYGQDNNGKN